MVEGLVLHTRIITKLKTNFLNSKSVQHKDLVHQFYILKYEVKVLRIKYYFFMLPKCRKVRFNGIFKNTRNLENNEDHKLYCHDVFEAVFELFDKFCNCISATKGS